MEKITRKKFVELVKNGYTFNYLSIRKNGDYLPLIEQILLDRNIKKMSLTARDIQIHCKYYTYLNDKSESVRSDFVGTKYYTVSSYVIVDFSKMSTVVLISI